MWLTEGGFIAKKSPYKWNQGLSSSNVIMEAFEKAGTFAGFTTLQNASKCNCLGSTCSWHPSILWPLEADSWDLVLEELRTDPGHLGIRDKLLDLTSLANYDLWIVVLCYFTAIGGPSPHVHLKTYSSDPHIISSGWWFLGTPLKNMSASIGMISNPILMGK